MCRPPTRAPTASWSATLAGPATSASATLTVLDYCASAQPSQAVYPMGATVPLSVQTFNCSSQAAVPNASAVVWISTGGTTRSLPVTTDASGSNVVNFVPLATEVGHVSGGRGPAGPKHPGGAGNLRAGGHEPEHQPACRSTARRAFPLTNTIVLSNLTSVELERHYGHRRGLGAGCAGAAQRAGNFGRLRDQLADAGSDRAGEHRGPGPVQHSVDHRAGHQQYRAGHGHRGADHAAVGGDALLALRDDGSRAGRRW